MDAPWADDRGLPRILPSFLFNRNWPAWRYIAVAWALAIAGSLLLVGAVYLLTPSDGDPERFTVGPALVLFAIVVMSPVLETIIMGSILVVLRRFLSPTLSVAVSAIGWGIAHSLSNPVWGIVIWWPFTIFSTAFLTWRERGFWRAVALVATIHAMQNLIPGILIAYG